MTPAKLIDVHHHIIPNFYLEALQKYGVHNSGGFVFNKWTPEASISQMDALGVETAICSISEPGLYPIVLQNKAEARKIARQVNELMAAMVQRYPGRFGGFALLPMPDVEASLAEIEYALDVLHLDGVGLLSNYQNEYVGNKIFDPIFQELNKRRACTYLHPSVPDSALVSPQFVTLNYFEEFCFQTTKAATNLILSGTMERCQDIKVILSHMGGTIPYLAWRLDVCLGDPVTPNTPKNPLISDEAWEARKSLNKSVPDYISMFYFDTALSTNAIPFNAIDTLAPSHILFGSDAFYAAIKNGKQFIENINLYFIDEEKRHAIYRGNAEKVFTRLALRGN